jgi:hypothetical protein
MAASEKRGVIRSVQAARDGVALRSARAVVESVYLQARVSEGKHASDVLRSQEARMGATRKETSRVQAVVQPRPYTKAFTPDVNNYVVNTSAHHDHDFKAAQNVERLRLNGAGSGVQKQNPLPLISITIHGVMS